MDGKAKGMVQFDYSRNLLLWNGAHIEAIIDIGDHFCSDIRQSAN